MTITRKALHRRSFLRGLGAAVGLPFLDAMVPAMALGKARAARPPLRMAFAYVPNGIIMEQWNPAYEGRLGELPRILKTMEPHRDDILMLGNLTHNTGRALLDGAGDHGRCSGSYLTGIQVKKTTVDIRAGVSCDQIVAKHLADQTRFPSLEVGMEDARQAGDCDSGYSCAYTNNLAWKSETQPLPPILDPRALFERLFGNGVILSPETRARQADYRRSILDFVSEDTRKLEATLGPTDRRKLDEYLSSHPRGGAADRARREEQRADRPAHGKALRRAGRFRRALQADDRHDHHRVPGGPDARGHLPDDARRHVARPIAKSVSPTATTPCTHHRASRS